MSDDRTEWERRAAIIEALETLGGVTLELLPPIGFEGKPRVRVRHLIVETVQGGDSSASSHED